MATVDRKLDRVGRWVLGLIGLVVWFGINHGVIRWLVGGILLTYGVLLAFAWLRNRRAAGIGRRRAPG
jgi:hypothetical protein